MRNAINCFAAAFLLSIALAAPAASQAKKITIIHTNDLQSRLLGFGPNRDYTPHTTGDDHTIGGIARLATLIDSLKSVAPERTLLLDGGDVLMGTLFHTIAREEALEYRLLARLGYDAVVIGNHEFDFGPDGLAQILQTAIDRTTPPLFLLSNAIYDSLDPRDDGLERLARDGHLRDSAIIERGGLRIGLLGLMGNDAAQVAAFASPVRFTPPVPAARAIAKALKAQGAEVVIALSHGGVVRRGDGSWRGDDIDLAREVAEVDVIVGGHSHTALPEPIFVAGKPVVQAGSEARFVGVLDLLIDDDRVAVERYVLLPVNDRIPGNAAIQAEVERCQQVIDEKILQPYGYRFAQVVVETAFDLRKQVGEAPLGNLVADAMHWSVERHDPPLDFAVEANGQLRDDILRGATGQQQVSDLFRIAGLGQGIVEEMPGYPLVKIYLTAPEIKKALEVLTTLYPMKGPSYHLQLSGLRMRYNPNRVPFDRVVAVDALQEDGSYAPLPLSTSNSRLYSIATNFYVASFIKIIGSFTYGLLDIVPKDAAGEAIADLRSALVDADPRQEGVQELKEWVVLLDYVSQFADTDGNGIPDVPEGYRQPEGRIIAEASWNPIALLAGATLPTWATVALLLLALVLVTVLGRIVWRKLAPPA